MEKTLYITRHGQTDYNKKGIVQGSGIDSNINTQGKKQAAAFYNFYKNEGFDKVITSNLVRTHQSMDGFIKSGLEWLKMEELDEICWGIHEGKHPSPKMRREYLKITESWGNGNLDIKVEGGESPLEVQKRMEVFLNEKLPNIGGEKLLICSHGRSIRILLCTIMGIDLSKMDNFPHRNLNLYKIKWTPTQSEILFSNDVRHLKKID